MNKELERSSTINTPAGMSLLAQPTDVSSLSSQKDFLELAGEGDSTPRTTTPPPLLRGIRFQLWFNAERKKKVSEYTGKIERILFNGRNPDRFLNFTCRKQFKRTARACKLYGKEVHTDNSKWFASFHEQLLQLERKAKREGCRAPLVSYVQHIPGMKQRKRRKTIREDQYAAIMLFDKDGIPTTIILVNGSYQVPIDITFDHNMDHSNKARTFIGSWFHDKQ